jgi:uncharacterized protein
MSEYYVSQYLNVIDIGGSALLFSGASGVTDEISHKLAARLSTPRAQFLSDDVSDEEILYLARRGYITQLSLIDEVRLFCEVAQKLESLRQASARKHGHILILLTYDCNLDCHYCFQRELRKGGQLSEGRGRMSPEFVSDLFTQHFKELFPDVPYNQITLTLYGGEPILPPNRPTIERLLELSKNNPIGKLSAITNGTQIESMLNLFGPGPGRINHVQISLDGDREAHDESRVSIRRAPTFDLILSNVQRLLKKEVAVTLRINVTPASILRS